MTPPHAQQSPDVVSAWLKESNQEYFGAMGKVASRTVTQALVGAIVFLLGVGFLLWQIL